MIRELDSVQVAFLRAKLPVVADEQVDTSLAGTFSEMATGKKASFGTV